MRWASAIMGGLIAGTTIGLVVFGGEPGHIIIGVSLSLGGFVLVARLDRRER